jgi:hypothetical protein
MDENYLHYNAFAAVAQQVILLYISPPQEP